MLPGVWICHWGYGLYLRQRHERKKTKEKKKEHREEPECAKESKDVDHGWRIVTPTRRKEIARQGCVGDYEALKPHSDVNEDGNDPDEWCVLANSLEPEQLRTNDVARNHDPISPPVITESTIDKGKTLIGVGTVPSDEELHSIGIAN